MSKWKADLERMKRRTLGHARSMAKCAAECPPGSAARDILRRSSMVWLDLAMPLSQQALWGDHHG